MIPITVLKTRFESGKYNYTRMSTALLEIYSREGVRGLSCGLVSQIFDYFSFSLNCFVLLRSKLKFRVTTRERYKQC